ncbi:MAG: hypothetical protein M0P91_13405 [Sulfuricurvum sp.]|jgi:hypothetical protein|uniref:hypothetical protein n=1 Tax=Sulfuricurvum sp. TaxID=2025608 RepID=UPI0025ED6B5B|nr:hypothetical protein [Sulfuricurvum sp.]MCK9374173.1 hypothetical protein [Sulfuricurvum sp.]
MKRYKTFEELQSLGVESVHEQTHISRDKIELILTKSYGEINKIQFMGFISILEREYGLDLSEIKQEFNSYQQTNGIQQSKQSIILQPAANTQQKWVVAGLSLIVVLLALGYSLQTKMSNFPQEEVLQLSSSAIEVLDELKEVNTTQDLNVTQELNTTGETNATQAIDLTKTKRVSDQNVTNVTQEEKPQIDRMVKEGLEIRPVYKVWFGLIDLDSGEKSQRITKDPITVDPSKNWLIVLGHGRIEIASPSGSETLRESGTVWFSVENGILKRISQEAFKERNGGKNW